MTGDFDVGFISANFVARAADYPGGSIDDWGAFDRETRASFDLEDVETWVDRVAALGVDGLSLWSAHCWYHDANEDEVDAIAELVADQGLDLYSYAGSLGAPPEDDPDDLRAGWERTFAVAEALDAEQLVGGYGDPEARPIVRDLVERHGVDFAYENHPEGSVSEIEAAIDGYEDCMGVGFDTGWAGTQGFDAPAAIRELDDRLLEVHLKDVEAAGGHETCALGEGVVDVAGCLDALDDVGYDGWVSIEHEPFDRDPIPEVEKSLAFLEAQA